MKSRLGLGILWQDLLNVIYRTPDVKVWQRRDRKGRITGWYAYDPKTEQVRYFNSELEVRVWLDQRYSH
jgi:hypothetical protein